MVGPMNLVTLKSFRFELEKISARRGLKEIAKALQAGEHGLANRLAKTPGVLKATSAGSQLRELGKGGEGTAALVAHPQHGIAARKMYNPNSVNTELINRKEQAGKALGNNPHAAKFLGSAQTPAGGSMHFNEYVQGKTVQPGPQSRQAVRQANRSISKGLQSGGFAGAQDLRPENMIRTPTGQVKAVDYLPAKKGEFYSGNERAAFSQQLKAQTGQTLGKNHLVAHNNAPDLFKTEGSPSPSNWMTQQFKPGTQAQFKAQRGASTPTNVPAAVPTKQDRPMASTVASKPKPMAAAPPPPTTALRPTKVM